MQIQTSYNITDERIIDLLGSAIEGGSNYWCQSMDRQGGVTLEQAEFRQQVPFVEGGWLQVTDEDGGEHRLDRAALEKGMRVFASDFPKEFEEFMAENDDAGTADTFLQCCCFGKVIYG